MSSSPPLLLLLLSPEGMQILGVLILTGLYIYLGWYLPISKIRDSKVKTKTGWIMLLLLLGIAPIVVPLIMAGVVARRNAAGAAAAAGTTLNASPGPAPVANNVRGALPVNRPSAAY